MTIPEHEYDVRWQRKTIMTTEKTLQDLRSEIDHIDEEIVHLLVRRFAVTRQVGKLKAREALPAVDLRREAAQKLKYEQLAAVNGLSPTMVAAIFRLVIEEVVREHREA
ncbi:MAG: chorismate mutase [Burkholderiaceae bacterium]